MEANPWAVAVFLVVGAALYGYGMRSPVAWSIFFVAFVILWLAAGMLWDWWTIRRKDDR